MSDTLYLVCAGELAEFTSGEQNRLVLLNLAGPGGLIGEKALLQPEPYATEIVANKDTLVIKLPRRQMAAALIREPALKNALQHKIDAHNHVAWISTCPLLQDVPLGMRKHLAAHSSLRQYGPDILIHQAGDCLSCVDLVVRGAADYRIESDGCVKRVQSITVGSLVGAVMQDHGCPADMVSGQGVDILHIPYTTFRNVTEAYPPLRKALLGYAARQQILLMRNLTGLQTQQAK